MRAETLIILAATVLVSAGCGRRASDGQEATEPRQLPPVGFFIEDYACDTTQVRSGETFTGLMNRLGLDAGRTWDLVQACDSVFDVRKMRAGNEVMAYYSPDSLRTLQYVVYTNDRVRSTVFRCDSISIRTVDKPVVVERRIADITIHSSLWNDMMDAGCSPLLIVDLADIYAWTVNFFALQEGDRFRAIYEQKLVDGEVIAIDKVDFAIYDADRTSFTAIRYDDGKSGNKYWNEKGESMKKAFLKAPLKYNRISSRFSYHRKHPVTGKVKAHTAVDYAAPTGTPVHSIGDGTVTMAGWDGTGGGNRIRIRHMNGYETCYMHLSRFAPGIKSGSRVGQGQLIGYVGATGTATGPHLDFRVWKDGKPIDPLKMISPPADPLGPEHMDSLLVLYKKYLEEIDE